VKQKTLVSAIKKTLGAEILISAAFVTAAYGQAAPATGASAPTSASAPVAASSAKSGVTQLQKVEVTGSLIRSSDKVGYNQVQTITAAQIQASGAATVAQFLENVAANSASSWNESTADSFAPGGAGIALRGLSEKYTLVLIDGVRVAPYALAVNATDTFFDLNSLPLNMIDHIEIVKTGAVSQYGSDAIAGVVNIITKKNEQGLTIDGSIGGATSGGLGTDKIGVTGGFGNLSEDRFNVTIGASFFKQNGFTEADRSNTSSEDYSSKPYGADERALNYWEDPSNEGTGAGQAFSSTCPSGQKYLSSSQTASGNAGCAVNEASAWSLEPDEERASIKTRATFQLTDTTQAYADVWFSRNTTTSEEGYAGIGDSTLVYDPSTGGVEELSNILSAGNKYNTTGGAAAVTYNFSGEPYTIKTTANYFRAATGLKGTVSFGNLGDWDWDAEASHSQSIVDNYTTGILSVAGVEDALSSSGTFNWSNPTSYAGLYTSDSYEAISMLDSLDLKMSNSSLFTLPAGDVGFGMGAQLMHESELITTYSGALSGTEVELPGQEVDGDRNVAAAYYQIDVPIITGVSFSQSGRYDHYSDFGGAFSPRFALRWQPIQMLTAYASYSRGFRAPTLVENSQSTTYSVQDAADPYNPDASLRSTAISITEKTLGNPDLQPERTQNYNVGFELSPTKTLDLGLDWYKINIKNVIGTENVENTIDENDSTKVIRDANGNIEYVYTEYENLGNLETDGFEATFRKTLPTKLGSFTLSGDLAYVWHFKVEDTDGNTTNCAGNNACIYEPFGAAFPRWKGNVDLNWAYRKFSTDLLYEYYGPYTQTVSGVTPGSVASYSQFNLNVSYTGFKHWTIYGGINNIFNRQPPYDAIWVYEDGTTGYDQSLYNDDGRTIEVGATYRF